MARTVEGRIEDGAVNIFIGSATIYSCESRALY